jgi:hypothetical protein
MTLMQGSVKVDRAVFHETVIILNEAENFKRVFKDIYKSPSWALTIHELWNVLLDDV